MANHSKTLSSITVIEAHTSIWRVNPRELWHYRELLWALTQRDLKARYKQTIVGGLWAILQPFVMMIVFSFFFGKLAQIPSDGLPYPIFSYAGLILWTMFSNTLILASNSLVANSSLITKVYFPKIIIPIATTLVTIIDYCIALLMLFFLMIWYRQTFSWTILFLPLIVFMTWIIANGLGLWLSAINVKYRDVRLIVPFFIQIWMFATPVIYPASVSGQFSWIVNLNPLSGLIESHRAILLDHQPINWFMMIISAVWLIIFCFIGYWYFRKMEMKFADII